MMEPIRIAFITIEAPETICGKNTTLSRLKYGLEKDGNTVLSLTTYETPFESLITELQSFRPHVIHGFHAYKAGRIAAKLAKALDLPLLITITGTDLNQNIYDPDKRGPTLKILNEASHLVCANSEMETRLRKEFEIGTPASVISKSVFFPDRNIHFGREDHNIPDEAVVFLFPSGIRRIKNVIFPIQPLLRLYDKGLPLRLIYLGRAIEADYFETFRKEISDRSWIDFTGEKTREEMFSWYKLSDIVLNTSHAEGGSNVVIEAMAAGKCVVASNIEGNRAYIDFHSDSMEHSDGVLYDTNRNSSDPTSRLHDTDDFESKVQPLVSDSKLRTAIGNNAALTIEKKHSLEIEINGYLKAYREVLSCEQ